MKKSNIPFIAVSLIIFCFSIQAVEYRVTEIAPPESQAQVYATALNRDGTVAGTVYGLLGYEGVVFIWSDGQMTILPNPNGLPPRVYSGPLLNNFGDIVAQFTTDPYDLSFTGMWRNNNWIEIPTFGGIDSIPRDLNDQGQVVGRSALPPIPNQSYYLGFTWQDGILTDLPTLGFDDSVALCNSNSGDIAGLAYSPAYPGLPRLVLWTNGQIIDLGRGFPEDMNQSGHLVGHYIASGETNAVDAIWVDGQRTLLPQLPGRIQGEAKFINEFDHIAGVSQVSLPELGTRVFLYKDGAITDIGNLGFSDTGVRGLNNRDQIIGLSAVTETGMQHPFIWDGSMLDLSTITTSENFENCDPQAINDAGQVLLNCASTRAFLLEPYVTTNAGTNIHADLGGSISLTFSNIVTAGETRVVVSPTPPTVANGFQVNGVYYDFLTTATYSGNIEVVLPFNPNQVTDPSTLRIFHYETSVGAWVEVPTTFDSVAHTVKGEVSSLSWFAVGVPNRMFSGFLPPLSSDENRVFKIGRTIPIKFQLRNASGNYVTNAVVRLYLSKISNSVAGSEIEAVSTSNADTGNTFRYSAEDGTYIFNLGTSSLTQGTWRLRAVGDDGVSYSTTISLKKK